MFSWIFGNKKKTIKSKPIEEKPKQPEKLDSILACAKFIIDNGEILHDFSDGNNIPSVIFGDEKKNTLRVAWYCGTECVDDVTLNGRNTPKEYHQKIFCMAKRRISKLQKKYLEETIKSVNY